MPVTRALRAGIGISAIFFAALVLYVVAAAVCALIPIAGRPQKAALAERPVYLCSDLVHSDFAVPLHDSNEQWSSMLRDFPAEPLPPDVYLLVGWGDLDFFSKVPTWNDVTLPVLFSALTGQGQTAIRLVVINNPIDNPDCKSLPLDGAGRAGLWNFIGDELTATSHRTSESAYVEYLNTSGRYSVFYTCNQWIARGLAAAAFPHAWFAPFSFSVTWPLSSAHL